MTTRIGSKIRKCKAKLTKTHRTRGKISLGRYFQSLNTGDKVVFKVESSVQKGMFPVRHNGRMGVIVKQQGECYQVEFRDGDKLKKVIAHPVHLVKL